MNAGFPFRFDSYGRIEEADSRSHIREMIEQILFTIPGERVNRPEFGCGIQEMVFGSTMPELLTVRQSAVQSQLQHYLGHMISLKEVRISAEDSRVNVLINYTVLADRQDNTEIFTR